MRIAKYQEIAAKISALIDEGAYSKGSKLPPHRELAATMQTTAVTVAKAYNLLVEQRRIESFVGKGSYVLDDKLSSVIHAEQTDLNFSILQPCFKQNIQELKTILVNNLQDSQHSELFGYIEDTGLLKHRVAGANWCREFGLKVEIEQDILLTNGAQNALSSLIQMYSKAGECIAVEQYCYPGILSICKYLERRVVAIEMDDQGMLPAALDKQCRTEKPAMVIIVPSHQNPTGATMGKLRRKAVANVIKEHKLWLVEDDIYAFLNDEPLNPISNIIPLQSFYISSLSKAVMPGLRCGYLKVPTAQRSKLIDFIRSTLWLVSPFMFEAASAMIESGKAFEWAKAQQLIAKSRQKILSEHLGEYLCSRQSSSYSCWLHLPDKYTAKYFTYQAKQMGVLVSDSSYFSMDQNINAVRLSVMAINNDSQYIVGLKLIKTLLKRHVEN